MFLFRAFIDVALSFNAKKIAVETQAVIGVAYAECGMVDTKEWFTSRMFATYPALFLSGKDQLKIVLIGSWK